MPHAKTKFYSISDLADEFDITTRTIRHYEDEGLLSPTRQGQKRLYTNQDRIRLKLTLRGKRLGFSLSNIRELFELYDADKTTVKQLRQMLTAIQARQSRLKQQLDDIQAIMEELETAEAKCYQQLSKLKGL